MEMEFKSRERRRRRRRESAEQNKKQRRALLSLPFFSSPCSCSPRNHHASNRAIIAPTTKRQLPLFFVIPSNLFCSTEYGVAGNERKNTFVALHCLGDRQLGFLLCYCRRISLPLSFSLVPLARGKRCELVCLQRATKKNDSDKKKRNFDGGGRSSSSETRGDTGGGGS